MITIDACKEPFPVLVVDDSPVARKLVERALSTAEHELAFANSGEEALELLGKHRPGLVITDWLMPDLSGIELCERIRRDYKDRFTYIILLTSISDKSEVVRGLRAGADDYLTKPCNTEELRARVGVGRRIVGLHREIEMKNCLLEQLALTDPLTELPNRRAVEQWAKRQLSGAARHDFSFWLVTCDLDQFKRVNDSHGHEAGDRVLKKFAEILKANTRQCDICGRLGGDEFLTVITYGEEEGVRLAVERIRQEIEAERFQFGGREARVTASFGIACFHGSEAVEFSALLGCADEALYFAKRAGRNRIEMTSRRAEPRSKLILQTSADHSK